MKTLASLALLGALVPFRGTAPATVTERTFSMEVELASTSFAFTVSEEGIESTREMPPHVREEARLLEVLDDCPSGDDPCPVFTRDFRTVATSVRVGDSAAAEAQTVDGTLQGASVTFTRKERGGYDREGKGVGVRRLKGLRANLGLEGWLPEGRPEAGATWEVSFGELARLLWPLERELREPPRQGGTGTGLDIAPTILRSPLPALLGRVEGVCRAELLPSTGEGGGLEARLEYRFEGSFDGSGGLLPGFDGGRVRDDVTSLWEGAGTLRWDPTTGAVEVTCKGTLRLSEAFDVTVEEDGNVGNVAGSLVLEGPLELSARQSGR